MEIFLDRTPFYAEAGGQVGDSGVVEAKEGRAIIARAFFTPAGQIVHEGKVQSGCLSTGDCVTARVERIRRRGICRSHTATHLLHRALKETLGEHVNQAGSLVSSDRLRFDFTHFKACLLYTSVEVIYGRGFFFSRDLRRRCPVKDKISRLKPWQQGLLCLIGGLFIVLLVIWVIRVRQTLFSAMAPFLAARCV